MMESSVLVCLQRKRTLLREYRDRHKTNQLMDKRFGEYDQTLTAEEKMMKRFMMEKQVCGCVYN